MTLNGHFALKSVLGTATNGLASPAFGQNCSKICRATQYPYTVKKCSLWNIVSGSIRFMQIFAGVAGEGASNESGVVQSGDFRIIRSVSSERFTYTWPHDSFQEIQLSMTLGIFQSHWLFHIKFLKNGV